MSNIMKNIARIFGVYPGYDMDSLRQYPRIPGDATQIIKTSAIQNTTVSFYTVTAGKTLYLCAFDYHAQNNSGAQASGYLRLSTNGAVEWYRFALSFLPDKSSEMYGNNYVPAIEIPAGYYFKLYSSAVNMWVTASIFGYEI